MKHSLIIWIVMLFAASQGAWAQTFSHKEIYDQDFVFTDGLYLTKDDLKNNKPIEKSQINSRLSTDDLSFFDDLVQQKTIQVYDKLGNEIEIESSSIFGYCSEGTIYINHNKTFSRIGIVGNICHFLGTKTVYNNNHGPYYGYAGIYNPYYPMYQPTTSTTPQQYFYNFETGDILEYNADNLATLLMTDPGIHDEFKELSRKKRNAKLFYYMRLFNEKHPLYIPVYE